MNSLVITVLLCCVLLELTTSVLGNTAAKPKCGQNEVWRKCAPAEGCELCGTTMCTTRCRKLGCACKLGFKRLSWKKPGHGCVPRRQCPPLCSMGCSRNGCACKPGFSRLSWETPELGCVITAESPVQGPKSSEMKYMLICILLCSILAVVFTATTKSTAKTTTKTPTTTTYPGAPPLPKCGKNEELKKCAPPARCDFCGVKFCPMSCRINGCTCKEGYKRLASKLPGQGCVKRSKCPPLPKTTVKP